MEGILTLVALQRLCHRYIVFYIADVLNIVRAWLLGFPSNHS